MKRIVMVFLSMVAFATGGMAASRPDKPALLLLPDLVSIRENLIASVEFRWDGDAAVTLDTWSDGGRLSTLGEIRVFDENGKEVPIWFPVSLPLMPTGKIDVKKREVLKIGLYLMGRAQFPRPGRYYAIATFSSAFSDGENVRFTTKKRWFEVTSGGPKSV